MDFKHYEEIASRVRTDIVKAVHKAGSGHPGGSLSAADIVTALSDHAAEIASASAIPIYHTSYVLLAGKRKADEIRKKKRFELIPCIREGKVLISSGFKVPCCTRLAKICAARTIS